MEQAQLLFLDWDGPVVNSISVYYGMFSKLCEMAQVPPVPLKVFRDEVGMGVKNFYTKHQLIKKLGWERIQEFSREYEKQHWEEMVLNPNFAELLMFCGYIGVPVVIISNNEESTIEKKLEEKRLKNHVAKVMAVSDKGRVFRWAIRNIDPKKIVYVDDCAEGITAAKKCGIVTIGFTDGYNTRNNILKAKPDFPRRFSEPREVNNLWTVAKIIGGNF